MRDIVIFLNGERGLKTLEVVVAGGHGVRCAVTPDNLAGSDVAKRVVAAGVEPWPTADVNDAQFVDRLRDMEPRLGLIAGYSTIFKRPLIEAPALGTINLHAGPLPRYRGGSPLNWQIINGETTAGVSVIRIDEGIDTGPVLAEATFEIGPKDTIADAHAQANRLFPELVLKVLDGLDGGTLTERPQDEDAARYWFQRKAEDGRIDWPHMTAKQVHDLVRAVTRPYPGAFTEWEGRRVHVFAVELANGAPTGAPGQVYGSKGGPAVICREGAVMLSDFDVDGDAGTDLPTGVRLGDAGP